MKCETCAKEVETVRRILVTDNYDRSLARPLYNCLVCYAKKEARLKKETAPARKS